MRDRVGVWAVVRVKRFTNAKSRLASPVLGCGERRELARRMFEDVLEALSRCQDVLAGTIVVTDVLSPIALWGLTSLYPVGHSSIFSRASSRSKKTSGPRHSIVPVALKLSTYALSVGWISRIRFLRGACSGRRER